MAATGPGPIKWVLTNVLISLSHPRVCRAITQWAEKHLDPLHQKRTNTHARDKSGVDTAISEVWELNASCSLWVKMTHLFTKNGTLLKWSFLCAWLNLSNEENFVSIFMFSIYVFRCVHLSIHLSSTSSWTRPGLYFLVVETSLSMLSASSSSCVYSIQNRFSFFCGMNGFTYESESHKNKKEIKIVN